MSAAPPIDPAHCPLCGKQNQCAAVYNSGACWCVGVDIPKEVLARVGESARGVACICRGCVDQATSVNHRLDRLSDRLRKERPS